MSSCGLRPLGLSCAACKTRGPDSVRRPLLHTRASARSCVHNPGPGCRELSNPRREKVDNGQLVAWIFSGKMLLIPRKEGIREGQRPPLNTTPLEVWTLAVCP